MSIQEVIADYENLGCRLANMGRAKIPSGYAIMLNPDESHFFWISDDYIEGPIHWNKWEVLRMVRARSEASDD